MMSKYNKMEYCLNGIRDHDLCDTGAVFYQLSYQANWELATLRVRDIPVEGEVFK